MISFVGRLSVSVLHVPARLAIAIAHIIVCVAFVSGTYVFAMGSDGVFFFVVISQLLSFFHLPMRTMLLSLLFFGCCSGVLASLFALVCYSLLTLL